MRETIIKTRGYDQHIAGSELSLKIASYPVTAEYLAARLAGRGNSVCELCCGIGITLIALSKVFDRVIGIDNDLQIIKECETNLHSATVTNYSLLCEDISKPQIIENIKADIVLYDIPYWSDHGGKVNPERQNPDLEVLIGELRAHVTEDIVIYTPPSFSYDQAATLLGDCDFVQVMVNGEHDRNFIFLGELRERSGVTSVELKT
jgi:methylase of polypeptide subunit release factors